MKQDAVRTQWLNQQGITILRFDNRQVLTETEAVLSAIYFALTPSPSPTGRGERRDPAKSVRYKSPLPAGEGLGEGECWSNLEALGYGE